MQSVRLRKLGEKQKPKPRKRVVEEEKRKKRTMEYL